MKATKSFFKHLNNLVFQSAEHLVDARSQLWLIRGLAFSEMGSLIPGSWKEAKFSFHHVVSSSRGKR